MLGTKVLFTEVALVSTVWILVRLAGLTGFANVAVVLRAYRHQHAVHHATAWTLVWITVVTVAGRRKAVFVAAALRQLLHLLATLPTDLHGCLGRDNLVQTREIYLCKVT